MLEYDITEDKLDLMKGWLKNEPFKKAKLNKAKIRFIKQSIRDGYYSEFGKKQLSKIRGHYIDWLKEK